jgi:hypothetical protein
MSKKKTQIDRAIESLDADIISMQRTHDAQVSALFAAISKLRDQQNRVPLRRKKKAVAALPLESGAK